MEETSNAIVDVSHHKQLPQMRFFLDLLQVMGVGDSRISSLVC